ncbi:hypothetical protein PsorP6_016815 [Peronosclerospora sorghi]|uniref:Uncharacterized protein n=1 Tax=Peronosclerospora sorghi TaxID=230839 RepID=A0ACC0WFW7_9STRA|nr:hypothetical protein PsorP6_016815 [Peronosclerospora sorghi]
MSGFERILARVSGDALRSYCSSAIEDEMKNLHMQMQACLEKVEHALNVQRAVAMLDVPLSRENAATCAEIKRKYAKLNCDLQEFVHEQRKLQQESPEVNSDAQQKQTEKQRRERVTKLLGKIQHRITRKRSEAWIDKNFADVTTIAEIIRDDAFGAPDKELRNDLVLVLDHLISAVLLSPLTTQSTLHKMNDVLSELANVHVEIDAYIKSSSELLTTKRSMYASQNEVDARVESNNIVDASGEKEVKRQRVESAPESDLLVKQEQTAVAVATAAAAGCFGTFEVFVSDLPWGTAKEADVVSYFGIAGTVKSVEMPKMADGSTVGVAIVSFETFEGMSLALRMNGYPFNGKNIRVAVHKSD